MNNNDDYRSIQDWGITPPAWCPIVLTLAKLEVIERLDSADDYVDMLGAHESMRAHGNEVVAYLREERIDLSPLAECLTFDDMNKFLVRTALEWWVGMNIDFIRNTIKDW